MLFRGPVRIEGSGAQLVEVLEIADSVLARLRGLLGRRTLPRRRGLLLRPCSSVHTWFMRFPIDVAFLDGDDRVISIASHLVPFRVAACVGRSVSALEMAAGTAVAAGLRPGDRLVGTDGAEVSNLP